MLGFVTATADGMQLVRSACHSICLCAGLAYCKSNKPISLKFVVVGPTNRKNCLTSGAGEPVPDTDSGSLFHFPHHCRKRDFRRFISSSHTVTGQFSRHSSK